MKIRCRRLIFGAFAAVLALGQIGCGGDKGSGGSGSGTPSVSFVVANTMLDFAKQMGDGYKVGVSRVGGVTGQVVGPNIVDGNKQLQMFKDLTTSSKDGVSVFTLAPEIFTPAVAAAAKAGLPMIAVDNPPLGAWGVKLFVGNDNYELGRTLAREAIAKLPANAKGKIVIGTSAPAVKVLDRRAKGIRDEIKAKLPGVTVVGPFDTKQEVAANLAAWQTLTQVNKGALAFLGTGDADGWDLAEIRRKTKATWVAGAFDLDPKSLAAVKSGDLVLVSPEHFVKGEVAGWLQAQHAKDGEALPEGWIYTPGLAVNASNVDAIIARQQSSEATAKAVAAQVDTILGDKSYLRKLSEVS
jgi:ribose transport system substrate-binding protein